MFRFMGSVDFVDDMSEWLGIELDSPLGRHDGTVQGVRYFAAGKDRGVFVTMDRVNKLRPDQEEQGDSQVTGDTGSVCESRASTVTSPVTRDTGVMSRSFSATPTATSRVRRSLSLRHHEAKISAPGQGLAHTNTSTTSSVTPSRTVSRYDYTITLTRTALIKVMINSTNSISGVPLYDRALISPMIE